MTSDFFFVFFVAVSINEKASKNYGAKFSIIYVSSKKFDEKNTQC